MKKDRREQSKKRLKRIKHLREINAPQWVIKSEQIAMVLNRKGYKHTGIGSNFSNVQANLYAKHVTPLMEHNDED
jgi:hypothetical protein